MSTMDTTHTQTIEQAGLLTGQHPSHTDQVLQVLSEAFKGFTELTCGPEGSKQRLQQLHQRLHAQGLAGSHAIEAIRRCQQHINWEGMDTTQFTSFYRFVFFICRELPHEQHTEPMRDRERRNIQVEMALQAWQLLLRGRFRLLEKWCAFVAQSGRCVITDDTWNQVLDFSRAVHEDLGNYDLNSAWPVLLDEFVEYVRARSSSSKLQERAHSAGQSLDLALAGGNSLMVPVSPRCGSKRRAMDVEHVTEQLQLMPLVSSAAAAAASASAAPSSPVHAARVRIKRICGRRSPSSTPQPQGATASVASPSHLQQDADLMSPMSDAHSPMWSSWDALRSGTPMEPQRLSVMHQILQQTVTEALDLG